MSTPKPRRRQPVTLEERARIAAAIESQELSLGEAVRAMRKITGMTQAEYAEKIVGVTPRVLMEIERGRGNPTLETLQKIGKPFGYTVGFVKKK